MVKAPLAGRVKTRLGDELGCIPATWWYRHQVKRTLQTLRDPRWHIVLAVARDRARFSVFWPADLPRVPQGRGHLGQRMRRAMASADPGPVVLIGSDIPSVTPAHIW